MSVHGKETELELFGYVPTHTGLYPTRDGRWVAYEIDGDRRTHSPVCDLHAEAWAWLMEADR